MNEQGERKRGRNEEIKGVKEEETKMTEEERDKKKKKRTLLCFCLSPEWAATFQEVK